MSYPKISLIDLYSCLISFFSKRIEKNYNSYAYTTTIFHKKIKNNTAFQNFTKNGPLAFLPISDLETSIVYSLKSINKKSASEMNDLIEKYSVFKKYPSTLKIKIDQTKFLAQMQINNNNFLLGSNGRFIKTNTLKEDLPFIFGNFNKEKFFQLKKAIDETDFDYNNVRNLFFFKS